ncbi:hypothetical protein Tco_0356476 [Tanacetum coccineum]
MIQLTDSRLTRNVSLSIWKYSERFSRSVLDLHIKNLMNLLLRKKFSPSSRNLATLEILRISLPWLLIICINLGELLLQSKWEDYRFTKAIIHHFLSKDGFISMRNKMFMHTDQDDIILGTLRFVSKDEDTQVYGALIPAHDSPMIKTTTTSLKETPSKKKSAPTKKDVSSKKPSRKQSTGVQIRDTPGVFVSKKKTPATTDKSEGIDLLSEVALLEDAQMNKVLKRSKRETHSLQPSGADDGVGSQPKVPDEPKGKTIGTNEGTGTKLVVLDVPKDQCESKNESWGESGDDDDSNDDDASDDDGNDDDGNDDGGDNDSDDERTESDEDKNPNLNQKEDDIEEEHDDEYVRTSSSYESTDDENKHMNEEEYDHIDEELYKNVNVKLKDVEHGKEGKGDAEKTDVGHDDFTQETSYDQVEDDAHVTLTAVHDT